jgi:hypothetical protein
LLLGGPYQFDFQVLSPNTEAHPKKDITSQLDSIFKCDAERTILVQNVFKVGRINTDELLQV